MSPKNNFITFASFNNLSKINENVILVWSKILNSISNSKILLKSSQLDNEKVRIEILEKFKKNGVAIANIILEGKAQRKDILEKYNEVDIALDPFPYNGVVTTMEAILMGVPVLTKKGLRPHSKMGESINNNANMTEWTAKDDNEYISKAIKFSSNIEKLYLIKNKLKNNIDNLNLFNSSNFANDFNEMLWQMWEKHGGNL